MFCKTSRAKVSSDHVVSATEWVKEKWGPLISKQEGFKKYYFAANPDGALVFIMLWEKEDQIQAWTDHPEHKKIVPELMKMTTGAIEMNIYEVKHMMVG